MSMILPKISVVTPSYNQGTFIADCIRSVVSQGYPKTEHIVVDNCSSDETLDVLGAYNHLSHLTAVSESDDGQTDAINKGLKMATGDVLAWLNADDYYLPGAFEKISWVFREHPELDLVYGEAAFVDARGNLIRVKHDHAFDHRILLYYGCYIMSTATFFRRRIVDDGVLLDPGYKVTMDYEYFVRLASLGYRFGFVPAPLAAFRWHDSNVSSRLRERRRVERLAVQRQYGGLEWLKNDALRVRCFDGLARVYQGKRAFRRSTEKLTGARRKAVL